MSDFSQVRAFNVGVAQETSIEAALIYDDLVYAQKVFGEGYFFRSDEQMLKRFPFMSKSTVRRNVARLVELGYITTVVKKVNGKPTLNYQIEHFLLVNLNKTKEMVNLNNSINIETKKETKKDFSDSTISFGEVVVNSSPPADGRTGAPATALLLEIIQIVNPREKGTSERLRMLNGRLKDYTGGEIIFAAQAFSKSEWHIENKQMSIDNLLAPSKFGRWYAKGQEASVRKPGQAAPMTEERKRQIREEDERDAELIRQGKWNGPN